MSRSSVGVIVAVGITVSVRLRPFALHHLAVWRILFRLLRECPHERKHQSIHDPLKYY